MPEQLPRRYLGEAQLVQFAGGGHLAGQVTTYEIVDSDCQSELPRRVYPSDG